ncbi:MAG TPA: 50S ribosomal protein L23, partial [Vampirovibrionales bacterium]
DLDANKINAKKALEEAFDVSVESVWTHTRLGKTKYDYRSRKTVKKKGDKKIMIFKLKEGDKIAVFDQ